MDDTRNIPPDCAGMDFLAADRGPVAVASVLAAQFATFGTLAGVVFLRERLHPRQWVGVAVVIGAVSGISAIA